MAAPGHERAASCLAERVVFILVQPQQPGNVGAVARAMMNMGLRRLTVVDPPPSFDLERARWMGPGAGEVLDRMRLVATLDEALDDVHRAIATTARHRSDGQRVLEPAGLASDVFSGPDELVTGVLLGREDDGLARAATLRCEALLRIPTDHHASLNLAQAALLVGSALFDEARRAGLTPAGRIVGGGTGTRSTRSLDARDADVLAPLTDVEPAVVELVALLNRIGYGRGTSPERVGVTLREALQRAGLSRRQVGALRGMVGRVEYALDHPDIDWKASRRQQEALRATRAAPLADDDGVA